MKKILTLLVILITTGTSFGQAPQKINYQAVVRDNGGASVTNQLVGIRVSILEGSSLGPEVFAETHGPTTNGYGLINIQIGTGSNMGQALSTIDWGANTYFVKIEIDPSGGTTYSLSSVSQLLSVPYALHAKTVENPNDADADPTNEYNTGAILNSDTLEITDGGGTFNVDLSPLKNDPDMDATNEIQTLSKVGQVISLSNGGGAFTDDVNDADNNPNNELNGTLLLSGTTLQLTDAGGTLNADLSSLGDDADADPTNEFQTISKSGSTVTLSNAGGSFVDEVNDADANPTNEIQTLSKTGSTVSLSNGGGSFVDDVNDADANPTNEIQTVNKVGTTVTLSSGGGSFTVDDADASATNEFNIGASLTGTDLNITDGGGTLVVDLSSLGGGNATDELNTSFYLDGDTLKITDAGGTLNADLSPLITGGGDLSTSNELNTGAVLNGTDLEITDPGGTLVVDLSTLGGGNPTDELNTSAVLNGTDLEITDAGGTLVVDLSSLGGGNATDELNTTVVLNGTTLEVTDAGGTLTADLSSLVGDPSSTNELITGAVLNGTNLEITDAGGTTVVDLSSLGGGPQFTIGQYFGGGIIIYVDSTGDHGIIASIDDFAAQVWDPNGDGTSPYNADSNFDGGTNTTEVYGYFGATGTYAARTCVDYSAGGFTDWYLPALFELEFVFANAHLLGNIVPTAHYWSSTEVNAFQSDAINYVNKEIVAYSQAGSSARVRPIRRF